MGKGSPMRRPQKKQRGGDYSTKPNRQLDRQERKNKKYKNNLKGEF